MSKNIVTLPGDGIGPEVIAPAVEILSYVLLRAGMDFSITEYPIGGAAIDLCDGNPFPEDTEQACLRADAVLLGAVGGPQWENGDPAAPRPEQGLLGLRRAMKTHANLRPVRFYPALGDQSSLKTARAEGTDLIVVRELLGGRYYGEKGRDKDGPYDVGRTSERQIRAIGRTAFDIALTRSGHVMSVDKANVLETSRIWRKLMAELQSREYPNVKLENMLADNANYQLGRNPRQFDVVVMENEHGDILSDGAANIPGSIGLLPSASISRPIGRNRKPRGIFEPIHGAANDIAGQDKANPVGAILSMALALEYCLDMPAQAEEVRAAVEQTFEDGVRTPDLGGSASTDDVTEQVIRNLLSW